MERVRLWDATLFPRLKEDPAPTIQYFQKNSREVQLCQVKRAKCWMWSEFPRNRIVTVAAPAPVSPLFSTILNKISRIFLVEVKLY
jgi:hypothetical protein